MFSSKAFNKESFWEGKARERMQFLDGILYISSKLKMGSGWAFPIYQSFVCVVMWPGILALNNETVLAEGNTGTQAGHTLAWLALTTHNIWFPFSPHNNIKISQKTTFPMKVSDRVFKVNNNGAAGLLLVCCYCVSWYKI